MNPVDLPPLEIIVYVTDLSAIVMSVIRSNCLLVVLGQLLLTETLVSTVSLLSIVFVDSLEVFKSVSAQFRAVHLLHEFTVDCREHISNFLLPF